MTSPTYASLAHVDQIHTSLTHTDPTHASLTHASPTIASQSHTRLTHARPTHVRPTCAILTHATPSQSGLCFLFLPDFLSTNRKLKIKHKFNRYIWSEIMGYV